MKKLVLLATVLVGAAGASQAGMNLHLGFNLPLPPLPGVVISRPAPVIWSLKNEALTARFAPRVRAVEAGAVIQMPMDGRKFV